MQDAILIRLRRCLDLLLIGGGGMVATAVLLACVLLIWLSVSRHLGAAEESMAVAADQSEKALLRTVTALHNDKRSLASHWVLLAEASAQNDDVLRQRLADAVARVNKRSEFTAFALNAALQPLLMSTEIGQALWVPQSMPTELLGAVQAVRDGLASSTLDLPGLDDDLPFQWLLPYTSPVTGQKVVSTVTMVRGADARLLGYLVFEYPLGALVSAVAWNHANGGNLVLDSSGVVIADSGNIAPEIVQNVSRNALAAGAGWKEPGLYADGYLLMSRSLAPIPWHLVYVLPFDDILAAALPSVLAWLLAGALLILLAWHLLRRFRLHVITPLLAQSQHVFESEQLSRLVVDTAPVGFGLIALETGQSLLCSANMQALETRTALRAETLSSALRTKFIQQDRAPVGAGRERLSLELSFATQSGSPVWLLASAAQAHYRGQCVLVVVMTDITNQKLLECTLHEDRRTADSATAAKSAFLAMMSHEIRTPLSAMVGNLELLARSSLDHAQRHRLDVVRQASDDLLSMAGNVLDLSRIEADALNLERILFDVNVVAARAVSMFAPLAEAKGLTLVGDFGSWPSRMMRGDPARLSQLFNNLLSNAVKFTSFGRVTMTLTLNSEAGELVVAVTDTGIGMSAEQLSGLFQTFTQADSTVYRRFGGTGLGLALCARLAQAMGGSISATSELDLGSCVTLCLPLHDGDEHVPLPDFAGEQVVLVTDDSGAHVARALRDWGVRATVCSRAPSFERQGGSRTRAVILWGDRVCREEEKGNRWVDDSLWVLRFRSAGSVRPIVDGRQINGSIYGLASLHGALQCALQRHAPPVTAEPPPYVSSRRFKVLVVEDHPVARRLLQEQLTLLGCDVQTACNGQDALRCMQSSRCDVLLTDLTMPDMDGAELVRVVRQTSPRMPVFVVTADVTLQQVRGFSKDPYTTVLSKPLTLDMLRSVLSLVASQAPAHDETLSAAAAQSAAASPEDLWAMLRSANEASLEILRQAWEEGNIDGLQTELHTLRGALSVFGMDWLSEQSAELMTALSGGDLQSCYARFMQFCVDLRLTVDGPDAHHATHDTT